LVAARLESEAWEIGRRITRAAIWNGDRCTWPAPDGSAILNGEVYEGTAGIAWFLAHLAAATGDRVTADTARGAARHAVDWLASDSAPPEGLHAGVPGSIWAVTVVSRRLGSGALLERAGRALTLHLERVRLGDPVFDIVSGSTGSLLALIALARSDVTLASDARKAGWRLAEQAEAQITDPNVLIGTEPARLPRIGLAHGVSGLAWSLLELDAIDPNERLRGIAAEAQRYERAWFDPEICSWRDPASGSPTGASWCRGSAGVGLARLRAIERLPDDSLKAEAGAALAALHSVVAGVRAPETPGVWEQSNCSVCHGLMGMADTLLFASGVLGVQEHRSAALHLVEHCVRLKNQHGFWPCGTIDRAESFGLMLGLAGIGAVLLRVADPRRLPPIGLLTYSTSSGG
jgi:lantibiotic biosynthesis protein